MPSLVFTAGRLRKIDFENYHSTETTMVDVRVIRAMVNQIAAFNELQR